MSTTRHDSNLQTHEAAPDRDPPSYQDALEDDSIARKMHSIIQQTYTRETNFSAKLSGSKVRDLAWFLIDVLAIDYNYNDAASLDMPRRRRRYQRLRFTLDIIHPYYVPGSASARLALSKPMTCVFSDLNSHFYEPARELGILPCAIDAVLHRYFKYTPMVTDGYYTGCTQEVYKQLGVDGLAEKISWDWVHLSKPLERFSARSNNKRNEWSSALHYKSILRTTQDLLPQDHPTRYLMEHVLLKRPDEQGRQDIRIEVKAQRSPKIHAPDRRSSKELQDLISQGDRWLRFTDCSGREAGKYRFLETVVPSTCLQQ